MNSEMSSGCPSSQFLKLGDAMRLLSFIDSVILSLFGIKVSISKTPKVLKGGFCIDKISFPISKFWFLLQKYSKIFDNNICSRELIGSASIPIKPNIPLTIPCICSLINSDSSSQLVLGASNECKMETGVPASLPGVYIKKSVLSLNIFILFSSCPQSESPFFHISACC